MASTFSTDLKLELMATGENAGTWGTKTNTNLQLVQQAIGGFEQVTLSSGGTLALAMSNGAVSNARNMIIKFATITAGSSTVCTVPDSMEKMYIFDVTGVTNPTNLTIKTASGTGFTPDAQKIYFAYADGTNLNEISLDTLGGLTPTTQGGTGLASLGSAGQVLKVNSGGNALEYGSVITDMVGDTSPQLGGNLDVNGQDIVSVSNGNIDIIPNGTGRVVIGGSMDSSVSSTGKAAVFGM